MNLRALKCLLPIAFLCFSMTACKENSVKKNENLITETEVKSEQKMNDAQNSVEVKEPKIIDVDFSSYFEDHNGSAVLYNTVRNTYEIYNMADAKDQHSPCSTFKIVSTLAALEYGMITEDNSLRKWSGEVFWNDDWNADIALEDAFKASCIWYFREIIDEIGQEKMQSFIGELNYGNQDISDWEGKLNKNNNNRALTGFWVESSLLISPIEQVDVLNKIFGEETSFDSKNVQILKNVMRIDQNKTDTAIYGKTGYGKLGNVSLDSWFVGMFESNFEPIYFSVHLSETEDTNVTSALAKEIAIQIIADHYSGKQ